MTKLTKAQADAIAAIRAAGKLQSDSFAMSTSYWAGNVKINYATIGALRRHGILKLIGRISHGVYEYALTGDHA